MQTKSLYYLECFHCKGLYTSSIKDGVCPHCHVPFTIIWPGEYKSKVTSDTTQENEPLEESKDSSSLPAEIPDDK